MDTKKEEFETTCNLFIQALENYFKHLTDVNSEIGVPFIKESETLSLKSYTGLIGISGNRKGFVYISADKNMYADLINIFIGIEDPSTEDILDMAGEISNVIAGSVRANYGNSFNISVPIVFEGMPKQLKFPQDVAVFVIPMKWKGHEAFLVVGLE
jgi:chemotaxis protein CheX